MNELLEQLHELPHEPTLQEAPLTFLIIGLTCLTSYRLMEDYGEKEKFMFHPYSIKRQKEWYRFFSHGLIHGSWMHLFFNMFVLYMFGTKVEMAYSVTFGSLGSILYLLLYGSGIIMASVYSYYKHQDNNGYRALGASGAIGGVVFAFTLFLPLNGIGIILISDITGWFLPAFLFGMLYLAYSAYMSKNGNDNIGHDAHYWGSVWGFIFTLMLAPNLLELFLFQIRYYIQSFLPY